ncbi:MAG TPA: penicillin-binding protein activator [Verrucomicrobiae bacterium]|jgi:hypothetical protein
MDPRQRVAAILKEWLDRTRDETQAIQAGHWAELRTVQDAKTQLRQPLGQAVEAWRALNPAEAAANPFRPAVEELLALETQNASLLADRKHRAQEEKRLLEQAQFNLRRIRSSYAGGPRPMLNSYS